MSITFAPKLQAISPKIPRSIWWEIGSREEKQAWKPLALGLYSIEDGGDAWSQAEFMNLHFRKLPSLPAQL